MPFPVSATSASSLVANNHDCNSKGIMWRGCPVVLKSNSNNISQQQFEHLVACGAVWLEHKSSFSSSTFAMYHARFRLLGGGSACSKQQRSAVIDPQEPTATTESCDDPSLLPMGTDLTTTTTEEELAIKKHQQDDKSIALLESSSPVNIPDTLLSPETAPTQQQLLHVPAVTKEDNIAQFVVREDPLVSQQQQEHDSAVHPPPPSAPTTTSTAAAPLPFPKQGVQLCVLDHVIELCGGEACLEGKSTTEVCNEFIKPMTAAKKCSFCDKLIDEGHGEWVQRATVFISHAWKFSFLHVVNAIKHHFRNSPDIVIWFDLFSNNQHAAPDLDFLWWSTTFKEAIAGFQHTVLVLAPWNNPIPLTRAWCLFEIYQTVETGSKFEVAMSKNEYDSFWEAMKYEGTSVYLQMLGDVNVEKSEAFNPADKEKIFEVVRAGVGFQQLNSTVLSLLRKWVMESATAGAGRDEEDLSGKMALANLLSEQGEFNKAEEMYVEVLEKYQTILGSDHPDTLGSMNNLALNYSAQGKYPKAEEMYVEVLEKHRAVLGPDHPDTLMSMNNLAANYNAQGKYEKAEEMYVEVLEKRQTILGPDHPDTLMSMNNLATIYNAQGKYDKAEEMYVEVLEKYQTVPGPDHPDTLGSMHNLAANYNAQGKYDKAEEMYVEVLEKTRTILGLDHPDTLMSMGILASFYGDMKKKDQSQSLYKQCISKGEIVLGPSHPSVVRWKENYRIDIGDDYTNE